MDNNFYESKRSPWRLPQETELGSVTATNVILSTVINNIATLTLSAPPPRPATPSGYACNLKEWPYPMTL